MVPFDSKSDQAIEYASRVAKLWKDKGANSATVEFMTVSEILDLIRKNKKNIKIKLVKNRIMNQLSYEVSSNKIKKMGLQVS